LKNYKKLKLPILITLIGIGFLVYKLQIFAPLQNNTSSVNNMIDYTVSGSSTVAIVQSSVGKAEDIQSDQIKTLVSQAVELAGGFKDLIKNGSTVVIKPNLVTMNDYCLPGWNGRELDKEVNGTTTDWRVAKAVVELVREYNPTGKVYIMEGSSGNTKMFMEHFNYTPQYIPGVDEFIAIEEDSGSWHDLKSEGVVKVDLPNGLLHKEYYLNKKYKEADVLISLPCLKNHWNAAVTGGIKNVGIGATPGNIYGIDPYNPGRNNMVNHDTIDLHKWIHDFFLCRPVDFVIMDGLQGIQNGPTPCYEISRTDVLSKDQMNMRLIIAGRDPVAVDTVESLIMNWDPQSVGYLKFLCESGAGNLETSKITVLGKQVDEIRKDFAGVIPAAGGAKVIDQKAPKTVVKEYSVEKGILTMSLNTDSDTSKVEVYVNDKMVSPVITGGFENCKVDISNTAIGNHRVKIWTFDKFLNRSENIISIQNDLYKKVELLPGTDYQAPRAVSAPVIDGLGDDTCWENAAWSDISCLWLGQKPSASDFSGRYKIVWTPEKLYYLVEINDNVLSGSPTNPLVDYYKYDTLELFIDEDGKGGDHSYNYTAFAYHIAVNYNVVDLGIDRSPRLFNDHIKTARTVKGNVYIWEIALNVYDDKYSENSDSNEPVKLTKDKRLGYAVAYCDNDGGVDRESFIGSIDIPGTDKNVAWQNASVFGALVLVD